MTKEEILSKHLNSHKRYETDYQQLSAFKSVFPDTYKWVIRAMTEYAKEQVQDALEKLVDDGFLTEHQIFHSLGIYLKK